MAPILPGMVSKKLSDKLLVIVPALLLMIGGSVTAGAEEVRLRGDPLAQVRLESTATADLAGIPGFEVTFRAAGVGRVKARFDRRWLKRWKATIVENGQPRLDVSDPLHFRGEAAIGRSGQAGETRPVAASVLEKKRGLELDIALLAKARRGGMRLVRVRVPVGSQRGGSKRRGRVVTRAIPADLGLGCAGTRLEPESGQHRHARDISIQATKLLRVYIFSDHLNTALHASPEAANADLQAKINEVNTVYTRDLDIDVAITGQTAFSGSSPYSTVSDFNTQLNSFRSYALNTLQLGLDEMNLAHNFTGQELDGSVVGFASVGGICSGTATGLTQTSGIAANFVGLIATHELGHNLGLSHVAEGIMKASLDPSSNFFSAESITTASGTTACLSTGQNATPTPTVTATATNTHTPTPSATPSGEEPTATPAPTDTPTPQATSTPEATATPADTNTPAPTATSTSDPAPTATATTPPGPPPVDDGPSLSLSGTNLSRGRVRLTVSLQGVDGLRMAVQLLRNDRVIAVARTSRSGALAFVVQRAGEYAVRLRTDRSVTSGDVTVNRSRRVAAR